MRVLLLRHADAGDPDPRHWPDDHERPLTDAGRVQHRRLAETLARMGIRFDHLLTSPLLRARQTAEITAAAYGWSRGIEVTDALGDRAGPADVLAVLPRFGQEAAVLCVGHEPNLSTLAALLISDAGRARIRLQKSGLIAIDCDGYPEPGRSSLRFHLDPALLLA
ncbi:MAG TPA: histidine phosphatase family protein [Methylomirabilota bacterium]|nr:histidine phosphatase family protein [Methylomirabilota bacterium]